MRRTKVFDSYLVDTCPHGLFTKTKQDVTGATVRHGLAGLESPPPQGTMSVQRRDLPPFSRPIDPEHMFDEHYLRQRLEISWFSATEAALNEAHLQQSNLRSA
jgi:hypothetical protein